MCLLACLPVSVSGCPGRVGLASVALVGFGVLGRVCLSRPCLTLGMWFLTSPVSRRVQIEGSCTVAGANLRTGRVMSGIRWQLREGNPARRRRLRHGLLSRLR